MTLKITISQGDKNVFKAVSWYTKLVVPSTNSRVDMIGDNVNLLLNGSVYMDSIRVSVVTKGEPVSVFDTPKVFTELVLEGPSENEIVEFIKVAQREYAKKSKQFDSDPDNVIILTWEGCSWVDEYRTPKRSNSSIYLPDNSYEKILKDLKNFYDNSERYKSLQVPYVRTYMFHGLPGTGKTSMIYTIASELDKKIAIVDFSNRDMSDTCIRKALYSLPNDTILCIEDMDALFSDDRKSDKPTITFSGILNILDGIIRNTGLVIMMTTNILSNIDDVAMKRRVDYYLKFELMKRDQIKNMFARFYPGQDAEVFFSRCSKLQLTPCILQKFFVRHLDSESIIEHVDELISMCEHDYKVISSSTMYS
jgi:hypothetical protein